ncbi:prepilin-type N-terminal cleavage/methylation domain-containing protein [Oceanirhabdus seepicola]|uniref:Prepilin-type N-terminal cleavage/methylation domain-containing protein n=1 Tax=Oceanirhabdus seepicola TaxID=2828781 RepID=A0A9J6P3D7_9CLOT|nr:prepilin-type N-terminal cleavage/methylation domain-containing protein [Oceanirhabdus seepicola]MCM1990569.1 prepilin-type N-terminal cleavage/methylation domain-containing protein [Oceanirhabdus seepicola]
MLKEIKNKKRKGFSLVELIVVIAIIGILAAIAVPKYSAYKDNANKRADEVTAKLLAEAALMAYEAGELQDKVDANDALSSNDLEDVWKYIKGGMDTKPKTGGVWGIAFSNTDKVIDPTGTITVTATVTSIVKETNDGKETEKEIETKNIEHTLDY